MSLMLAMLAITRVAAAEGQEITSPEALNPLHALSKDSLVGFRERPLFDPARAEAKISEVAPAVTMPPPPPPPEPPPALHLVGIIAGHQTLAIVKPADGSKTMVLASGDKVGNWTVTVSTDKLTLQADTRNVDIALFDHGGATHSPEGGAPMRGPPGAPDANMPPPTGNPVPP